MVAHGADSVRPGRWCKAEYRKRELKKANEYERNDAGRNANPTSKASQEEQSLKRPHGRLGKCLERARVDGPHNAATIPATSAKITNIACES